MNTSGLDRSYETTKQIITLSTSIIAFTVTFAKEFKAEGAQLTVPWSLTISWLLYCASVIFGVWTLLAITGTYHKLDRGEVPTNYDNIDFPAGMMIVAFVGGIVATIWSGFSIVTVR